MPNTAKSPCGFDPISYVNPELRSFLSHIQAVLPDTDLTLATLAGERARALARPPLSAPTWVERIVAGSPGSPDVRVYVVDGGTRGRNLRPAILHMHGGGFVMGDGRSALYDAQQLASALDCVVITVDYRLAPETPFPGALEDCYVCLRWLHRNAAELGVDATRIAVMGESAGGGHAAMLAIAARDRGEIPLAFQALIAPMLDDRTGSTRKKPPHMGMVVWNGQKNCFGWTSLLGVPAGSERVPHDAVPARIDNLHGLPPTFIGVGSVDLFVEEDIEYARRLIDAGIAVQLDVVPGAFHGFQAAENLSIVKRFRRAMLAALADALKRVD